MNTSILQQNNYNMDNQQSETAIQNLVETIGLSDAYELLHSSLHLIVERQQEMDDALKHNHEIAAKRYAHRTISSIRVYGSERLEEMLFMIGDQSLPKVNTPEFRQALSDEFESVISTVSAWLEQYCAEEA